jgi:HlyD family secretion protein
MTRARGLLLLGAVGLAVAGGLWWHAKRQAPLVWQGYAEADYVKVGPVAEGRLTQLRVERGQQVAAGAPLFDQDDRDEVAALAQARSAEDQARAQLHDLELPAKPEEIAAARANLADATATMGRIRRDLDRDRALVTKGFSTRQRVDQEEADLRSAEARQAALQATLAIQQNPSGREAAITARRHAVEMTAAETAQAAWRLGERHVVSPADAVVADVLARPGETLAAGGTAVSLLPPGNIFVRFFVGEKALAGIHLGDRVRIACDSCDPGLYGVISFIAPAAEYTPPVIYSDESREKLVTMIEARPPRAQAIKLNPGEPVQVSLP